MDSPFSTAETLSVFRRYGKYSYGTKEFYHNSVMKEQTRTEGTSMRRGKKGLDSNTAFVPAIHTAGRLTAPAKRAYIAYQQLLRSSVQ